MQRNPAIESAINPSGDAMDAFVFMPHDSHPKIGEFLKLSAGGSKPVIDYLRSATIEVPSGTKLNSISSKLSVDGKHTYSVDPNGFTVNEMAIGFDISAHGSSKNIFVVPSSFVLKKK